MATLDDLKSALQAEASISCQRIPLSDTCYGDGFEILTQGSTVYEDFIVHRLSELLTPLFFSRLHVAVLEIGPGPRSVLGSLPLSLRRKVRRYAAFEPNKQFALELSGRTRKSGKIDDSWLPCLDNPLEIYERSFELSSQTKSKPDVESTIRHSGFDLILFCHSMYGMTPKRAFIEQALEMLATKAAGMVAVFHRTQNLRFDGLSCHKTASYPAGIVRVANQDDKIDSFASFIAGSALPDEDFANDDRLKRRNVCRELGHITAHDPEYLEFSYPNVMITFNQHAAKVSELAIELPIVDGYRKIKNQEARNHLPALIVRPTKINHIQKCVQWALKYDLSLTVVSGSHSGHCILDHIVAIDMSYFDEIHIVEQHEYTPQSKSETGLLAIVQSGCASGDIVQKTSSRGLALPLGARPSVGAGLWLQGGIGHSGRGHGLTCDGIVGAVLVSVASGEILYAGCVPQEHRPAGAIRSPDEDDMLWALRGAGTNVGIVISIVFKTYQDRTYSVTSWNGLSVSNHEASSKLQELDGVSQRLPASSSLDVYIYDVDGGLRVGATLYRSSPAMLGIDTDEPEVSQLGRILGNCDSTRLHDSVSLFDADLYVSIMHGGHGGGKTSSFKRCVFLRDIGTAEVLKAIMRAIETRPSTLSYLHFLHGGEAISRIVSGATAFGCRDWSFACVITGVWVQELDGDVGARRAVRWVYDVVENLLPLCSGIYGADLGPDPRDVVLAAKAFGHNSMRLAGLKSRFDPQSILPFTCPLPRLSQQPRLILLVTGEICSGKDYCAGLWATMLKENGYRARIVSISEATKHEFALSCGVIVERLLVDRAYKEQHRPALTSFYEAQVQQRPWLPEEHFLNAVYGAMDVDALLITGMRDEAPVASYSHLVPRIRLLELRVNADDGVRKARAAGRSTESESGQDNFPSQDKTITATEEAVRPDFHFHNDLTGNSAAEKFAQGFLLPLLDNDLQRLAGMVHSVPHFPRANVNFRHILDIPQQKGGLPLCTSLLHKYYTGDWSSVDAVVCCETGGFVFGSALAVRADVPLAIIRGSGKLPPPKISVSKVSSHISALAMESSQAQTIEMGSDVLPKDGTVVMVDDVIATGRTSEAMLRLLQKAGIKSQSVTIMAIAEFPAHRGRKFLYSSGFGNVRIQSLLALDGL